MIRFATRLAPVALALATGACFATRSDVRILQDDLATTRAAMLKADSARASQNAQVAATLGEVTDSIRSATGNLARWQATVQGDLRGILEQLVQVQEQTGQSQNKLNELRAQIEERNSQPAPSPVAVPGDTTRPQTA